MRIVQPSPPFVALSLGAGVQSSTMALMAAKGEITPMPDAAIFADTHDEPSAVYRWLDQLEKWLPFPVYRVSHGHLGADFLAALENTKSRCGQPPFYVSNGGDDEGGMLWRKCTVEYKLQPIRRKVRELAKSAGKRTAEQWIGISFDERHRMKFSGVKWVTNVFPLVERKISRNGCIAWMEKHGYPRPPKSACVFCPYRSNRNWLRMSQEQPDDFEAACRFDETMRAKQSGTVGGVGIVGKLYVHRSFRPLREAALLDADQELFSFANECDAMCGV